MQADEIMVSVDMLRKAGVGVVIASAEKAANRYYRSIFDKKVTEAKENNDELFPVWCLLSVLTSMHFKPSDSKEPFGPMFVMEDCRSAIPSDITDESLNALSEWVPEIEDAELRARVADVLWLRRRKPDFIKISVEAYIKSALNLEDPGHWTACAERIQRALRLSSLLRRQEPKIFESVTKYMEDIICKYDGKDPLFLSIKLMKLLCEFGCGDAEQYYDLSCKIGKQAQIDGVWHKAEGAWQVAEEWASQLKDNEKRNNALSGLAETLAERAMKGDQGLASSKFMQQAIEVYRRVPSSKERRSELYEQLREYQKNSLEQMQKIEGPRVDLTESVEASRKAVSGKSFEDAIFNFAFQIARPPKYDDIKQQAKENSKKFVFSSIVGSVHFDKDALVVAETPAMLGIEEGEDGKAIWSEMLRTIGIHHGLDVQGAIEPARKTIYFEHNILVEDLYHIVQNNPFVPHGHEYIYAKGLYSGLMGDFVEALHLLVPQIENSLRYVLEQQGVETTTLNPKGIQERMRLGPILQHEKTINTIGKDVVLDLQALLIEPKYGNLRNEISHGFMSTNQFFQVTGIYLWWLVLRLCLLPYYKTWSNGGDEEIDNSNSTVGTTPPVNEKEL